MTPRAPRRPHTESSPTLPAWAVLCFLVSGAAGLLYEVVWSKQLSYLMGNSLHAVATVVAAFLAGLAIGAYVLGARLARRRGGVRVYAMLEIGIALLGLASMPALRALDPVMGALYRALGGETGPMMIARFVILFLVLLPPTIQMGATLPVLVAHFEYKSVGPALARLYAINTAGAVLGSLLAGFVLMPALGLSATTWVAAALNAAAAAIAWLASERRQPAAAARAVAPATAATTPPSATTTTPPPATTATLAPDVAPAMLEAGGRRAVAAIFALSGFAALAFQIAWVRLFGLLFGSSVYSFSGVLAVYLAGLAAGSALIAPWLRGAGRHGAAARLLAILGALQLALAVVTLASIRLFPWLPEAFYSLVHRGGGSWTSLYVGEIGLVALVVAIPCLGFGAVFPIAARLMQTRDGGHATGLAYAVNTAGTLAGSIVAGFLLIPALGVQGTQLAAGIFTAIAGLAALAVAAAHGLPSRAIVNFALPAAAACLALALTAPRWDPALMSSGIYRPSAARQVTSVAGTQRDPVKSASRTEQVLFYREGLNGSVYVAGDSTGARWLKVGGKTDASTNDMLTQVLLGVLPVSIAPRGARVAVIGLGSGITLTGALAAGAGPVLVFEIEPAVVTASSFFNEPGSDPLRDPRVTLVLGDARTRLFGTTDTWDVIVSEPSNPWIAGVNNLFTVDFYRRLRARLAPGGVFCQWIQLYELSPETLGSLLASYLDVFPTGHAFLAWDTQDLLLIGAPPGATLALERLRDPRVAHELARAKQLAPESIAAWYACPFDSLRAMAAGAPLNRDDRPVIEYRAARDLYRVGRENVIGPGVSRVPVAGWRAARSLFADWPADLWLSARARQLARSGVLSPAMAVMADAEREGLGTVARDVEDVVDSERRRRDAEQARNLARTEAAAGRIAEARDALVRAAAIDSAHGQTWVMLAEMQRSLGDAAGARASLSRAIVVGDSTERGYAFLIRGSIDMAEKKPRDAAIAFGAATRWIPRAEDSWLAAVQALIAAGDTSAARRTYLRGLEAAGTTGRLRSMVAGPGSTAPR